MFEEIVLHPIGILKSPQIEPYQASRQPDEHSSHAVIHLNSGFNFEQALTDLESCSHIWVIYKFHLNENWKPMVQPPRGEKKIGVFATRAPYRPNPLGLSVVKIEKIDGLKIHIGPNDILNDSPILDIKPYHPEYDRIDNAEISWLKKSTTRKHNVIFSPQADDQISFIERLDTSGKMKQLKLFILRQLEYEPTQHKKKRLEDHGSYWTLCYRTWRVDFIVQDLTVAVLSIRSGYTNGEINSNDDPYQDKDLHKKYLHYLEQI